jgi:hypothetical protein
MVEEIGEAEDVVTAVDMAMEAMEEATEAVEATEAMADADMGVLGWEEGLARGAMAGRILDTVFRS